MSAAIEQLPGEREAASLYFGRVMHARLRPKPHRFSYSVFMLLIDLDRIGEAAGTSRLFSTSRWSPICFDQRDHLPGSPGEGSLADRARRRFEHHGVTIADCRILLLCLPRIFGYAFNPITVFYAVDGKGLLRGMLYEVRNTFGERHVYAAAVPGGSDHHRHELAKLFHVSPFLPMALTYRFSVSAPRETILLRVMDFDGPTPVLSTGFHGERRPLTTLNLLRALLRFPPTTMKVIIGIHLEAARLLMKRLAVFRHPSRMGRA